LLTGATGTPVEINPIRYRGYYYDDETGLYYLQSRYYDAEIGRFINADDTAYLGAACDTLGYNLFVYCGDEPIDYSDVAGTDAEALTAWMASVGWLSFLDGPLPIVDFIVLLGGIVVLEYINFSDFAEPLLIPDNAMISVMNYTEHTKGARPGTEEKHEKGSTRKKRDNRGEKGDKYRLYRGNKRRMHEMIINDYEKEKGITESITPIGFFRSQTDHIISQQ